MIRNCDYCGSPYEPKRKSSRYCSAACRVNFNNLPGKLSNYAESAEIVFARMIELVDRYPHLATQFMELSERMQSKVKASAKAVADRHPVQRKLSPPPPPPAKRKAPAAATKRSGSGVSRAGKTRLYEVTFKYQKQNDDRVLTGKLRRKSELFGDALEVVLEMEVNKAIKSAGHRWDYQMEIVEVS